MDQLYVVHTKVTPQIIFNEKTKVFRISGRSIPADATLFFQPADKWAEKFTAEYSGDPINFEIRLDHLNTGSVRSILSILTKFIKMEKRGVKVDITWYHEAEDDDIRDKGEEMSLILEHKFSYVPYKDFTF